MLCAGHAAHMGELRNTHKILDEYPKDRIPLRRPRHKWKDYIKMGLKEIGCEDEDRVHLAQDRVQWQAFVNTVKTFRINKRQRIS
jgi:hypothetical protein